MGAITSDAPPVGIRLPAYASGSVAPKGGIADILDYVARVEDAGFDSAWVIDHLLVAPALYATSWFDPLELLAAASARTSRIALGTAILVVPLWHPVLLARRIATLTYICQERFVLGIGPGWEPSEFSSVGVPRNQRGSRTDESLELMKQLWSGEPVTFHGRHYDVSDVQIEPRLPAPPPIWVAGGSLTKAAGTGDEPRMAPTVLERIVAHQGWIARSGGSDFTDVTRDWQEISAACQERGLARPTFAHAQFVHLVESSDTQAVQDEQLKAFHGVMGTKRNMQSLNASYLTGTIDDIQARVSALKAAGLEYLIVNPVLPDPKQLDLVNRYITPIMSE